jgi:hypothetical protein
VDGKPDGGYTDAFEIICSACGDDPKWDYHDVPAPLRRIRGPYHIDTGVTQYEAHIAWHEALIDLRRLKLQAMTACFYGGCWVHGLALGSAGQMRRVTLYPGR